jgi:membrane protein required for colicin V production
MQNFTVFDIVIVSITVLLGLKGLLRGFIKEIFGLVGIIGGIFIASRLAGDIGNAIAPLLALENQATIKLIGFVIGLVGFWAIIYILGIILSKIFQASGLGLFDRILGFFFGSAKIFLIFSVIVYALYQVNSFKDLMNTKVGKSVTFPFLLSTGGFIVKLDANDFMKKVEEKITPKKENEVIEEDDDLLKQKSIKEELSDTVKGMKEATIKSSEEVVDAVKKTVNKKVDEIAKEIKNNPLAESTPTQEDTNTEKTE